MSDGSSIRSIAVHRDDVVTALEATLRSDRDVVLRITPPFSGRMRARIHDRSDIDPAAENDTSTEPINLSPTDLVDDVPPYPEPDETARQLQSTSDSATYDVDEHHERHTSAVAAWREKVEKSITDEVSVGDEAAAHGVDVVPLG